MSVGFTFAVADRARSLRSPRRVADRAKVLIAWTIAMVAIAAGVVWLAYIVRHALILIYVSVLLAIGFGPIVRAIERHPLKRGDRALPRWVAILAVYLVIVGVLTVAAILVLPPFLQQAQDLWMRLPALIDRAQTFLIEHGLLNHRITLEEAVRRAPGTSGGAVTTVATAVTGVVATLLGLITILILTFYLLVDSDALYTAFARLFPRDARPRVLEASKKISTKVSAWLSGQLILAGTIGVSAAVGLYLLGVPYFYVLGLIAAIGETVPLVGPILSAVPAILAGLSVSPRTALWVALFWIAQQQVENHLLVPKVMERQVGVSPVIVIVALLIGGSALGILGAVLAVPTAAIVQVLIQEILDERDRSAVDSLSRQSQSD
jgi:predicted PurR-regulated permease PerM